MADPVSDLVAELRVAASNAEPSMASLMRRAALNLQIKTSPSSIAQSVGGIEISKRDWIAAMAMQGYVNSFIKGLSASIGDGFGDAFLTFATVMYRIADAMVEQSEKKETQP